MPTIERLRVFISYALKDGAALAQRLQSDLTNGSFDAWLHTQRIGVRGLLLRLSSVLFRILNPQLSIDSFHGAPINQLAFVYLLTCHMRQIGNKDFLSGLEPHSTSIVRQQEAIFSSHFQRHFHDADRATAIRRQVASMVGNAAAKESSFLKTMGDLHESLESLEAETLKRVHAQTDSIKSNLSEFNGADLDPCLRYLNALRLDQLLQRAQTAIHCTTNEIDASTGLAANAKRGLSHPRLSLGRIARVFSRFFT